MQYKDKEGDYMELEFDVKVTPSAMYDYLLHHTYSGMSGIIGTVFGVFLIMAFLATKYPIYLIAGIVVIGYLPAALLLKAHQQVSMTPAFKEPLQYHRERMKNSSPGRAVIKQFPPETVSFFIPPGQQLPFFLVRILERMWRH